MSKFLIWRVKMRGDREAYTGDIALACNYHMQLIHVTSYLIVGSAIVLYIWKIFVPECLSPMEKLASIRLNIAQMFSKMGAPNQLFFETKWLHGSRGCLPKRGQNVFLVKGSKRSRLVALKEEVQVESTERFLSRTYSDAFVSSLTWRGVNATMSRKTVDLSWTAVSSNMQGCVINITTRGQ